MNPIPSNETTSFAAEPAHERSAEEPAQLADELLLATSRTFGLAIPLLPIALRRQVTLAYLLFRIADTIEDGHFPSAEKKLAAFDGFGALFDNTNDGPIPAVLKQAVAGLSELEIDNGDYQRLIRHLPDVVAASYELSPAVRKILFPALRDSVEGMRSFVAKGDGAGNVALQSLEEVVQYCYVVAGIVGEMLTELFLEDATELQSVADELRKRARSFGEGLQLVNILKDSQDDQVAGRCFIPDGLPRQKLFELARADLAQAAEYVEFLVASAAPASLIAFCDLPVRLALRTLDCVESDGPGSKISRKEVGEIVAAVMAAKPSV